MSKPSRYAVLGAAGQLGSDLCPLLDGEVLRLTRVEIDLAKPAEIAARLHALRPDFVINCAAYNFVDKAEDEPEQAFLVNAFGVRALAKACADLDVPLVHFSTDYVFGLDAGRRQPYSETDAPGPINVYGLSKLAGEFFVRSLCPKHYVIRTCGLYGQRGSGGKGTNFVETMLRVAAQGKPLRVIDDQICTPSHAIDVARGVVDMIRTKSYGLYHLTNAGQCSWYEFAAAILQLSGVKADVTPVNATAYGSKARRPAYSVLATMLPMRPWREALAEYLTKRAS